LEPREALHLAIAFLASVIDVVVAERAEVVGRQRIVVLAADQSRVGVQPDRAVAPGECPADVEASGEPRKITALRLVRACDDPSRAAFLMVDATLRLGGVGVAKPDLGR